MYFRRIIVSVKILLVCAAPVLAQQSGTGSAPAGAPSTSTSGTSVPAVSTAPTGGNAPLSSPQQGPGAVSNTPTIEAPEVQPSGEEVEPDSADEPDDETGRTQSARTTRPTARFGQNFFAPARKRILALEKRILNGQMVLPDVTQRDALLGFVGPLEMVTSSVYASIPHRYVLTPGDQVVLSFWGTGLEFQRLTLVVDDQGEVTLPKVGKMVARGMSLDIFQRNAKAAMARVTVKDLDLIATLDRLKSIQIFVTGEAFRPGSYAVSTVTTLFNALYAAGGPSDLGSLRDIRLLRNQQTIRVDFYDYLLRGDSYNDFPLQVGDTIFISPIRRSATILGEVNRPARYELKDNEQLSALIELAGKTKPTGVLQNVMVHSLSPNKERVIREVNIGQIGPDTPIYDGDVVNVPTILPEITNHVTLKGSVERPGVYELKENMRLAELFSETNRPLGESYMERADLIRLNEDRKTTRLIPIHLGHALAGDPQQNIPLAWMDQVVVYSKFDVVFYPARIVTILGAVQKPGTYPRADGMKLRDLLLEAGGVLPGYHDVMEIARARSDGEITLLHIDLPRLLGQDEAQNVTLQDEDIISVRKKSEFFDKPIFVTITGEVKYPGAYALRTKTDHLSDLVRRAGGFTEQAYPKGSVFTRNPKLLPFKTQHEDMAYINRLVTRLNEIDYERQVARNQHLLIQEGVATEGTSLNSTPIVRTSGTVAESIVTSQLPKVGEAAGVAAGQALGGVIDTLRDLPSVTSRPRVLTDLELNPSGRIVVDVAHALEHAKGEQDILLVAGDMLDIPTSSNMVSVVGAITRPMVIAHASKKRVAEYIARSGGYAQDADTEGALVLRVNGEILSADKVKFLERGDMVYVPPKVLNLEIITQQDKVLDLIKFTLTTAASVATFIALIGLL